MIPAQVAYFNKNPQRYFGVEYFLRPFSGSHPSRRYFSTTADSDPGYTDEQIQGLPQHIELIADLISSLPRGTVVGLTQNPDPYDPALADDQTMTTILGMIKDRGLGLYLETSGDNMIQDLPLIQQIKVNAPVTISVPVGFSSDLIQQVIIPEEQSFSKRLKLIQKLASEDINVGVLLKPIIPFVNDTETNLIDIIVKAKQAGAQFIYPSFGISLSPSQREAFMELVMRELPGLRNIFMDQFGLKKTWSSPKLKLLKKTFVINMKKHKLPFGMKDIIGGNQAKTDIQLKLF